MVEASSRSRPPLLIARLPSATAASSTLWFLSTIGGEKSRHWTTVVGWRQCHVLGSCEPAIFRGSPSSPVQSPPFQCLVLWLRSKGDSGSCRHVTTPLLSSLITWPIFSDKTHRSRMATAEQSPMYSPFFGVMGATSAMVFSGKWNPQWNGNTIFNFTLR